MNCRPKKSIKEHVVPGQNWATSLILYDLGLLWSKYICPALYRQQLDLLGCDRPLCVVLQLHANVEVNALQYKKNLKVIMDAAELRVGKLAKQSAGGHS
eukprot:3870701-Pleurochrysis_carterae.AAC.2